MRIAGVESTDLFVGTVQRPLQVVRVTLVNEGPGMLASPTRTATVHVQGPGVRNAGPFRITGLSQGEEKTFEVGVEITAPYQPGGTRRGMAAAESDAGDNPPQADITITQRAPSTWRS